MSSPVHPMDEALARRQWKRARLDDLKGESAKLAARIVCRAPSVRPFIAVIDIHMWLQGDKVRMELATAQIPAFLRLFVVQGLQGVTPHALGLVPCKHEPWHWNPFCLPLIWQQEMNTEHFNAFAQRYARSLQDLSWQCPDAALLMQ